jgi:hypothetical protein
MPKDAIPYRDVMVAPGSMLHDAIMRKDLKKAEEIYKSVISKYRIEFGVKND